jgi:hypothetical protein
MADIDLIYDADCPNAGQARINLKQALEMAGWAARWREWIRTAPSTPQHLRRFGSPTILVDGTDVAGREGLDGSGACRIYPGEDLRRHGAPAVSTILTALRAPQPEGGTPGARAGVLKSLAVVPGALAAFLPVLSCPACWPAYAGLLSSLGIGFLWKGPYLLPLTALLLGIALAALAHGAAQRRGYGPLVLGSAGSIAVLLARFLFDTPWIANVAAGSILVASVWNAWPRKPAHRACPACETGETS